MGRKKGDLNRGNMEAIFKVMLTCGGASRNGIKIFLSEHMRSRDNLIANYKREGLLNEVKIRLKYEKVRSVLRLNPTNKTIQTYIRKNKYFKKHYETYGKENQTSLGKTTEEKISVALKAYRESETLLMLLNSKVKIFPDEKLPILENELIPVYPPVFYNSLELKRGIHFNPKLHKENENQKSKNDVVSSRMIGSIFSEGGIYIIYNTENNPITISNRSEAQICGSLTRMCNTRVVSLSEEEKNIADSQSARALGDLSTNTKIHLNETINEAILIGYSDYLFKRVFENEISNQISIVNTGYSHIYMIPYNKTGQKMINLMTKKNWKETMKEIYLEGLDKNVRYEKVDCDAKDDENYYLLFTVGDLVKLKKFLRVAEWDVDGKRKYIVRCFDWQLPFINSIDNGFIEIEHAKFDEYYEYIFN